jgi:hypothetical protein
MMLVKCWVGPSAIHGLGLIAKEFIPNGTVVWKLVPGFDVVLTEAEFQELPQVAKDNILYYGWFDNRLNKYILSADDDRFTNHSDTPNIRFCGDSAVALCDIHPGEELTDNYAELGLTLFKGYGAIAPQLMSKDNA